MAQNPVQNRPGRPRPNDRRHTRGFIRPAWVVVFRADGQLSYSQLSYIGEGQ